MTNAKAKLNKLYYDFECYPNFWGAVFKDDFGRRIEVHSEMDYMPILDRLKSRAHTFAFIGYNNSHYDTVLLHLLLKEYRFKTPQALKDMLYQANVSIIEKDEYKSHVLAKHGAREIYPQVDVKNFLSEGVSLKEMGCRIHHPRLESIPVAPNTVIDYNQVAEIMSYCDNDVDIVIELANGLVKGKVDVLFTVVDYFNLEEMDLGSTLRQIAEKVLTDPSLKPSYPRTWRYTPPVPLNFKTQEFQDIEDTYRGLVLEPKTEFSLVIDVDGMELTLALGGAHGIVRKSYFENVIDLDVDQYYPALKSIYKFYGNTWKNPKDYEKMIEDKIRYGLTKDPREKANKEMINATFGAEGYPKSRFYSPNNLYATTITGQLMQLRLIEDLRLGGYRVIYVNTDGLSIIDNGDMAYKDIVNAWANEFGLKFKEVRFKRVFYRDVNNYVAEEENGKLKRKGVFNNEANLKASCFGRIAVDAVTNYLVYKTPIKETIRGSKDLRDFLMYHKWAKGMEVLLQEGDEHIPLPNVVRYYLSKTHHNAIIHSKEGKDTLESRNQTDNVSLVFNFTEKGGVVPIPSDLDRDRYVYMAYDMLYKINEEIIEDNPYIEGLLNSLA